MTDSGAERAARIYAIVRQNLTSEEGYDECLAKIIAIIREETGTQSAKLRDFLNVIISNGATLA